ncbi:DUF402 domain-containing protein [Chengkuizengella sp. SCS-71B]|uniref:DUF402 domain-containing protein n=1 Tax=Chengkuizengella sp. SCS-71B TaxID=3115290 RepID=UPI0032C220CF
MITIQAQKYDGMPHYTWQAKLLDLNDEYLIVLSYPETEIKHFSKNEVFTVNNWWIELYPFKKWFTISMEVKNRKPRDIYCNIAKPSSYKNGLLTFIDLDIDFAKRDGKWKVLDEDEFETHQKKYNYPVEVVNKVWETLDNLQFNLKNNYFPFDGTLETYISQIPEYKM